jgi:hypothetical protein
MRSSGLLPLAQTPQAHSQYLKLYHQLKGIPPIKIKGLARSYINCLRDKILDRTDSGTQLFVRVGAEKVITLCRL